MNIEWLDFFGGFLIGLILITCIFGVKRVWEKRGDPAYRTKAIRPAVDFEDFDIDFNKVAMPPMDPELREIYERLHTKESFVHMPDEPVKIELVDPDMFEKNRRAFEAEQLASLSITREARGYNITKDQCNNRNPDTSYPYYCVRHISHIHHADPKVRRHGYAGVFWD